MIPVQKNIRKIPDSLSLANCSASLSEVVDLTDPDHKKKIKQTIYGDEGVVSKLKAIYHNKCAYCEAYEPEPEVEHYRPKGRVQNLPGHRGYYWLCYEWTNLLPACHDCNKNGAKGNYFPVEGTRQTSPPVLLGGGLNYPEFHLLSNTLSNIEVPLFLNPEVPGFDPFNYFRFNRIGKIVEVPAAGTIEFRKAEWTIKIARFDRPKLFLNLRKKQIRYYMGRIETYIYLFLCGQKSHAEFELSIREILSEIKERTGFTKEYSFFWCYFYRFINDFIIAYIKPKYRPKLFQLINNYKAENP